MSELPASIAGAQPGNTAGRGSLGSAAAVTSRAAGTPPTRPAGPASAPGPVQTAISRRWGSCYLEHWVGVMPRLNDAKGGASSGPAPGLCLGILVRNDPFPIPALPALSQ